jgi:hypothetical protein
MLTARQYSTQRIGKDGQGASPAWNTARSAELLTAGYNLLSEYGQKEELFRDYEVSLNLHTLPGK